MHRSIYPKERVATATKIGAVKPSRPLKASYIPFLVCVLEGLATVIFVLAILDLLDAYLVVQKQAAGTPIYETAAISPLHGKEVKLPHVPDTAPEKSQGDPPWRYQNILIPRKTLK